MVLEEAVVIDVVVAAGDGEDVVFDQGVFEAGVETRRGRAFGGAAGAGDELSEVAVFGEGDVNECHVEVMVGVVFMGGTSSP